MYAYAMKSKILGQLDLTTSLFTLQEYFIG